MRELRSVVHNSRRFRDSRCLERLIDADRQLHEPLEMTDRARLVGIERMLVGRRNGGFNSIRRRTERNVRQMLVVLMHQAMPVLMHPGMPMLVHQAMVVLMHQGVKASAKAARRQISDQRHPHDDSVETSLHNPLCSSNA